MHRARSSSRVAVLSVILLLCLSTFSPPALGGRVRHRHTESRKWTALIQLCSTTRPSIQINNVWNTSAWVVHVTEDSPGQYSIGLEGTVDPGKSKAVVKYEVGDIDGGSEPPEILEIRLHVEPPPKTPPPKPLDDRPLDSTMTAPERDGDAPEKL